MQNYVQTDGKGELRSIVGPVNTNIFRNRMILTGIEFEVATGMKLTAKAPKCSTLAKKEWGIKGRGQKLIDAAEKFAADHPEMFDYINVDPPERSNG